MSAAAPTTTAPLPTIDATEARTRIGRMTVKTLETLAASSGVTFEDGAKAADMRQALIVNIDRLVFTADVVAASNPKPAKAKLEAVPEPSASTGDVDKDGDIIGAVECDDDGFPVESADVEKLDDDHLDALGGWLHAHPDFPNPPSYSQTSTAVMWEIPRQQKIEYIIEHGGYQDESAGESIEPTPPTPVDHIVDDAPAHIPTASPAPTTVTTEELAKINADREGADAPEACACNGKGGYETPGGWEKCTKCDGAIERDGQLSFVPGSDPTKFFLNVPSVRIDLAGMQLKKYDEVDVSFRFKVEETRRPPEKQGKKIVAEMETYVGAVLVDTINVDLPL